MPRIGITGASGFVGWHLRVFLHSLQDPAMQSLPAGRETFASPAALRQFVRQADVIVHLAGMNRGAEGAIEQTNAALTDSLIEACEAEAVSPHVIFANSTHADRDTAYGRSKRRSAEKLSVWARARGAKFTNAIIPGVFGERGRPRYNSVVSTFCYQVANGQEPQIIEDRKVDLIHAQDLAEKLLAIAQSGEVGEIRITGHSTTVSELLIKLRALAGHYRSHVFPSLADAFDLALFNTYRSYLFPEHYPVALSVRTDDRGRLFEGVKTVHGGQCFVSTTHPGVTRGNHYHRRKVERFLVIAGTAKIRIRPLLLAATAEFDVTGEKPAYVDIPTLHTHDITNVGSGELVTLFWANEVFDPSRPDTYPEPLQA